MEIIFNILKWIFIIVAIGVLGIGFAIFEKTLDRKFQLFGDDVPTDDPDDLMAPTTMLHYQRVHENRDYFESINFEKITISADDGIRLEGLFYRGTKSEETVILIHGYRGCPENEFCNIFDMYKARECNILCVYCRAHQNSGGRYIGFSELDAYDVVCWQKKMALMFKDTKIIMHGVSMGGATVIHCCDKGIDNVVGGISDCGFTSIRDITQYLMEKTFKLPYIPFGTAAELWSLLIAKIRFAKNDGYKNVTNTKIPICFIHGKLDNFVPVWMGVQLYKACGNSDKEMHVVENCGHAAACFVEEENYRKWINDFCDKCFK